MWLQFYLKRSNRLAVAVGLSQQQMADLLEYVMKR